ncbi:hypothetical protein SKAU_G00324260 [Synaphobranchus kaupii]|uniref:Uncharacterized protein n=1 Tax=Synaphobranchus kaupii TaxID=118154 RepID=A0A9Q1EPG1_SYNKA|nr:hypothetical protein SKAU_G00324260 [Synaphobranchus kaupii]
MLREVCVRAFWSTGARLHRPVRGRSGGRVTGALELQRSAKAALPGDRRTPSCNGGAKTQASRPRSGLSRSPPSAQARQCVTFRASEEPLSGGLLLNQADGGVSPPCGAQNRTHHSSVTGRVQSASSPTGC